MRSAALIQMLFLAAPAAAIGQAYEFQREGGAALSWGRAGFHPVDKQREPLLTVPSHEIDLDLRRPKTTIMFDLQAFNRANFLCDIGISEELYSIPRESVRAPQVVILGRIPAQPMERRYEMVAKGLRAGEQAHVAFSTGLEGNKTMAGVVVTLSERRSKVSVVIEPTFSIGDPPVVGPLTTQGLVRLYSQCERTKREIERINATGATNAAERQLQNEAREQLSSIGQRLRLVKELSDYAKMVHSKGAIYVRAYVGNATLTGDVR